MISPLKVLPALALALWCTAGAAGAAAQSTAPDPLPSWRAGETKATIVTFVESATDPKSPRFVPPPERIAVFDNDGTLWVEQPIYVQVAFAFARVRVLAPAHPEWRTQQPFRAILENDRQALARLTEHDAAALLAATHAGMTTDTFDALARDWLEQARHPKLGRRYRDCAYQPMKELIAYLRARGFKVFIVSGGGVDFLRAFAEATWGIPPEDVIGSSGRTRYELRDGRGVLVKLPSIGSVDDKEGKPINIQLHVGRRPLIAVGNSDGDLQMLEYATSGPRGGLGLLLHHDDAAREYAYDRHSHVGRLDAALGLAPERGWTVVSMKDDWITVFGP